MAFHAKPSRPTKGTCRDCQREEAVFKSAWKKAAAPRCSSCGGMLERDGWWCDRKAASVVSRRSCIAWPGASASEFEIQAFLYRNLRELGYRVRGEVSASSDLGITKFDLVLFNDDLKPVRIIELKRDESVTWSHIQQEKLYKRFGLPVDVVRGMDAAMSYLDRVKSNPRWFMGLPPG